MQKTALTVSAVIFLIVSMFHILRLLMKVEIIVGGVEIPFIASWAGAFFSLALACWMWVAAEKQAGSSG